MNQDHFYTRVAIPSPISREKVYPGTWFRFPDGPLVNRVLNASTYNVTYSVYDVQAISGKSIGANLIELLIRGNPSETRTMPTLEFFDRWDNQQLIVFEPPRAFD